MNKPTIYYYRVLGRGQFIFALLNYLEIEYDLVIFAKSIPIEIKEQCTFSQVPLYIDNDIKLSQTHAISRYISNKYNFLGKNNIEKAKCDEILESIWDCLNPVFKVTFFSDDETRSEFKKNNNLNLHLSVYEMKLNENKYIAGGDDYTYADLSVYVLYSYIRHLGYSDGIYPKLDELKSNFENMPQMKPFLEKIQNTKH